jgi:hypothetical protein
MAKAVKISVETNGLRINNMIASQTADSLIYANIQSNRARGLSSLWDSKNINILKNVEYSVIIINGLLNINRRTLILMNYGML